MTKALKSNKKNIRNLFSSTEVGALIEDFTSQVKLIAEDVSGLHGKVDNLAVKVDNLENKVDNLEVKVDSLTVKVDKIENDVEVIKMDMGVIRSYPRSLFRNESFKF